MENSAPIRKILCKCEDCQAIVEVNLVKEDIVDFENNNYYFSCDCEGVFFPLLN